MNDKVAIIWTTCNRCGRILREKDLILLDVRPGQVISFVEDVQL